MTHQNKDYGGLVKAVTERVDNHFQELSKIPRGSGNEAKAAQFIIDFAKALADKGVTYEYQRDEEPLHKVNSKKPLHDVVIKKPATNGRENDAPIVFQAHKDSFPEWTPNFNSKLKTVFETIYLNTFGEPAETLSIHAGLECGYFAKKFMEAGIETDFIAIGPTIIGAHTAGERLYWPSVSKIVELLLHVMEEIDIIDAPGR